MRWMWMGDEDGECSYISRISEPDGNYDGSGLWSIVVVMLVFVGIAYLCSGCATGYVGILRKEYSEDGIASGVYYGEDEYPRAFPATRIAITVEVPRWWSFNKMSGISDYLMWPIGAVSSLVDVPISLATDTIMLPYDITRPSREKGEDS